MQIDTKELIADVRKHVKVEVDLDGLVLSQVDKLVIPMVDKAIEKLCKAIPGPIDDAVVAAVKPQLYKELKEELAEILQKAEKKIDVVVHGEAAPAAV